MNQGPPPPYKESASMSRSRTSRRSVHDAADVAIRSSLSRNPSSPTTTDANPSSPTSANASAPPSPLEAGPISPASPASTVSPTSPASNDAARRNSARHLPLMGSRASRTSADRERMLQQENEQLRRELAGQRLLNERDRQEGGGPSFVSRKEEKRRVSQLADEAREARKVAAAEASRRAGPGIFKEACSTDLLFLIDRTYSMHPHIASVKIQVKDIVNDIIKAFFNEAEVRIAVATYTDHGDQPHVRWLDFTTSTSDVFSFLDKLKTEGGDDIPEDVLGGIQQALNASWSRPTRCIVHIADAPPHGRIFQEKPYRRDNYPEVGSEPHGLTYEPLLRKMIQLNINYFLLPIDKTTDRMAYCFSQIYAQAAASTQLSKSNRYFLPGSTSMNGQSSRLGVTGSKRSVEGRLLFVEAEPGAISKHLRSLVVKSVLSSAPRTAARTSASAGQLSKSVAGRMLEKSHAMIEEVDEVELEVSPPDWDTPGWLDERIRMEGFCPDIVVHGAKTLNDMMQSDEKIKMRTADLTIRKRSQPFAQGAMRTAAYARTAYSTDPFVVKSFKRDGKGLAHMIEDMQCQALCKAFALEFNALVGEKHSIDFIVTTSLQVQSLTAEKGSTSERQLLSLEPFIEGSYVKFNSNCGYVNDQIPNDPINQAAQAFSHFTFERSKGRFLVCDLQGVGNTLTDPAIHTRDSERFQLADCNLNEDGFKFFFANHECNSICHSLGLQSNAAMLASGKEAFKEQWPAKAVTTCCANKLCGKIVRLDTARKYRYFSWCDTCFPQINATLSRWPCNGHGLYHTFTASRFFYESQGRLTPRSCPTHQVRDEAVPGPPSDNFKFLNRLTLWGKSKT